MRAQLLFSTIKKLNPGLSSSREIVHRCNYYARLADRGEYDFRDYSVMTVGGSGRRERRVYKYPRYSVESVFSRYLAEQIKEKVNAVYPSKTQMINDIIAKFSDLKENDDVTLIRTDFVQFCDSVLTKTVFDRYIEPLRSNLRPFEYEMLKTYCDLVERCYSGLPLSMALCELPLIDMERSIRANTDVIAYYRYVDDMFLIVKGKWSREGCLELLNSCVGRSFPGSEMRIHDEPDKFSCIYLKDVKDTAAVINFIFRDFTLYRRNGAVEFTFDIDIFRRKMIEKKLRGFLEEYTANRNITKLKYQIGIYSSFSVFEQEIYQLRLSYAEWFPAFLYPDLAMNPALYGNITTDFLMGCIPSLIEEYHLGEDPRIDEIEKGIILNGKNYLFVRPKGFSKKKVAGILKELDAEMDVRNKDYNGLVLLLMKQLFES